MADVSQKCSNCKRTYPVADFVGEKNQPTKTCKTCRDKARGRKCTAFDRNNNPCRANCLGDTRFCKNHSYMCDYTEEMLREVKLCSGCKKMYYLGEYKICEKCRQRGEVVRQEARELVVLCTEKGCIYKRSEENEFCGFHQMKNFGKKLPKTTTRKCCIVGCMVQLTPEYQYATCESCLETQRAASREKREAARNAELTEVDGVVYKICGTCCKSVEISLFKNDKNEILKTCSICRTRNRKAVRQNIDEVKARAKELEENNPERQYYHYKKSAKSREIELQITFEEYYEIVKNPCYYCGDLRERGFNGLDRINSMGHYTLDNVVSCCTMCNYMKNALDITTFYHRIQHILRYNGMIDAPEAVYPEAFSNHTKIRYNSSVYGAKERNLEITISNEDFDKIVSRECYICGKQNESGVHQNGIDRFDSSVGYILENCRPCCGGCNRMKYAYSYTDFMNKLLQIHNHFVYDKTIKNTNIVNNAYFKKLR